MKTVKKQTLNRTHWNLEAFVCNQTIKKMVTESLKSEMVVLLFILYGSSTEHLSKTELALPATPRIGTDKGE